MAGKPLIGFIGQGFIGKNYADDFERRGFSVVRYALEEPYVQNKDKIKECDFVFIAVPTPTTPTGFNASIVDAAISLVGKGKTAVIKSTILPGTTRKFQEKHPDKMVMYSPEFLSEATAAHDAGHPFSNIIGLTNNAPEQKAAAEILHTTLPPAPFSLTCTSTEAEIIKYSHNGSGYAQIIFFNLMYDLATKYDCNWELIQRAIEFDPMISNRYARPIHKSGRGAGGHCFIKDVAALSKEHKARVGDSAGSAFFEAMERKNIELLRESGKDIDLLTDVYGSDVLEGVIEKRDMPKLSAMRGDMRLLVCTEALDRTDTLLGFFHRWVEEFARHARHVHVVCLGKGEHSLPANVSEHSLGKEFERGLHIVKRIRYVLRFLAYTWRFRRDYDTVLVHLSPEYILLAGFFWKLTGKRIGFWYNDASANLFVRMAMPLADVLFYANPDSYAVKYAHARQMPMGVDADMYIDEKGKRAENSLLSLGRITEKKHLDVMLSALKDISKEHPALSLDLYGTPGLGDEKHAASIRSRFAELERKSVVHYRGTVLHEQTPPVYWSHDVFVHLGSLRGFNKTLLEAASAGNIVVTAEKSFEHLIDKRLFVPEVTEKNVAKAIKAALSLSPEEREAERTKLRSYVRRENALSSVVPAMLEMLRRKGGETTK